MGTLARRRLGGMPHGCGGGKTRLRSHALAPAHPLSWMIARVLDPRRASVTSWGSYLCGAFSRRRIVACDELDPSIGGRMIEVGRLIRRFSLLGMRAMRHELEVLLRQVEATLASEYERIVDRAQEDPGTAGDEGEENWASFLRQWLPRDYHIVTKGRILSVDGEASPQVDVLVLRPAYPPALTDKKLYLAGGVAAAFECKTTLKKSHIDEAIETAAVIHRLAHPSAPRSTRHGAPYMELHSGIVYGLLAHSHSWADETAPDHITGALNEGLARTQHPREALDAICVANLGTWTTMRMSYMGPTLTTWHLDRLRTTFPDGYASCVAFGPAQPGTFPDVEGTFPNIPVAQLCAFLTSRLAWEHPSMRPLADYFRVVGMFGHGQGQGRPWPLSEAYSAEVAQRLRDGNAISEEPWSQWRLVFM